MSHVGQGLQDVVGHCKQEVGGEKPAEAEDAVAHWQRDGEESTKTREESSEVTAAQTSKREVRDSLYRRVIRRRHFSPGSCKILKYIYMSCVPQLEP